MQTLLRVSLGAEPSEKWLCKGIKDIRSVLGYPGLMIPSRAVHLIVLIGFQGRGTIQIVDAYEPQFLSLGCGEGTLSENHHVLNKRFFGIVASRYKGCSLSFSPDDVFSRGQQCKSRLPGSLGSTRLLRQ
ncbi:MAG: hypothetical protein U5J83_12570 [Bryobacterales bacterium]|nr:hypothetical protein [Bryobacterales bacterium]